MPNVFLFFGCLMLPSDSDNMNHPMSETASFLSYLTSLGLILNEFWQFLNTNAAGVAAMIAIMTYLTNLYFSVKNSRAIGQRLKGD